MSFDLVKIRAETPACEHLLHFNNAGAALSPSSVTNTVLSYLQREQEIGGYEAANEASAASENFYAAFAQLLGCSTQEIAYADSATHGWSKLFNAIPWEPGHTILTGQSEYASNYLAFLHLAKHKGVKVKVIPNTQDGLIDLALFEAAIDRSVKLIALTHVPSQSGVIHPASAVGALAKEHNILYLLDACQSAGQIELDVETLGCDMLTGTGRKYLRGPRGTGFLYLRENCHKWLEPAEIDLHSALWTARNSYEFRKDARQFESFECFVAGKIGLGVAVDYALNIGLSAIEERVQALANRLRAQLRQIPRVAVHEQGTHLSGIVTFNKQGIAADALHSHLQSLGMNTSVLKLASSQLDLKQRGLADLNRASVHYYNTEDEVDRLCASIEAA